MRKLLWSAALVAAVAALALGGAYRAGWLPGARGVSFYGGTVDPPGPAPDFTLTDQHGEPFRLSAQRGRAVVLFFGYTTCPDVCPTTLLRFREAKEALGPDAERVRFVLVTVDPERDTPARLAEHLAHFDPSFLGLSGDGEALAEVWRQYGVVVQREDMPDSALGYLVAHTSYSYAIDPRGNLRLIYLFGTPPEQMAADLRLLLAGR